MDRGDVSGTHRIVYFGELGNSGMVEGSKTRADWQKFREDRREFIEKWGNSYSGRIISSNGVDPFSKGYFQLYEGIVYEPEKFIPAHTKGMEEVWDYEGNAMLFGTYDVGAPGGATHWAAFGADSLQSLMLWKVHIEENNPEGQAEYLKSRGKTEDLTNYSGYGPDMGAFESFHGPTDLQYVIQNSIATLWWSASTDPSFQYYVLELSLIHI